jgi:CHAT domain-containing protein
MRNAPIYFAFIVFAARLMATPTYSSDIPKNDRTIKHVELLLVSCDSYLKLGNIEAGKKMIDSAEIIFLQVFKPDHLLQFRYCAQKGRFLSFTGQNENALQWIHRALLHKEWLEKKYSQEIARTYSDLADLFFRLNDFPNALKNYQLALLAKRDGLLKDCIETVYYKACLVNSYWNNCQFKEADELVQSCRTFLDNLDDPYNKALLDVYFAMTKYCFSIEKEYPLAEKYLKTATKILQSSYPYNHYKYGILFTLKGKYNYIKLDPENALQYCKQSMEIIKNYPSLFNYQIVNNDLMAGIYYYFNHDYKKAIDLCNHLIHIVQNAGVSAAFYYYIIGLSHFGLNENTQAGYYFRKAISASSTGNTASDKNICSEAYYFLSRTYSFKDSPERVLYYLRKALEVAQQMSTRGKYISHIYRNMGLINYQNGNYNTSLMYLQQSIIAACNTFTDTSVFINPPITDIQPFYSLIEALTLKANALYKANNNNLKYLEAALDCQELAVKLTQQVVIDINEEDAGLFVVDERKRTMNNAVSYATILYVKTGMRIYAEKALAYAEKSKMQVLQINTMKKNKLIRTGIPDSLIQKAERLNNEILDLENELALLEKSGISKYNMNLVTKLTRFYDLRDELNISLEENYPVYKQSKYNLKTAGMKKIQQMLAGDQVMLEYQLLQNEIIIFVITHDDFNIHYQLIDKQVHENIEQLRNTIASGPNQADPDSAFQSFIGSSHYLYKKLIEPVYDKIKGKRLIIIPHNELTLIPFEILISKVPANNSRPDYRTLSYMIREFPIVYAYSANFLLDQDKNKKYGSGTAIFLPDYNSYTEQKGFPDFQLLKGAIAEASAIRKLTGGKLYSGKMANEKTFKEKAFGFRVLHIASHTLVDEKQPSLSCLVMTAPSDSASDGYLYAYELRQMKLNAQLVVLSGCNTGFGKLRLSEGLVSLARSFFYTGVRTMAFTLWPVADNAGSRLISSFYSELRRHRFTLDNAMREAKLDFLKKTDPVKAHPFYWAGYVIVGKEDPVPLGRPYLWPGIILASLLITVLSVLLYRKFRV